MNEESAASAAAYDVEVLQQGGPVNRPSGQAMSMPWRPRRASLDGRRHRRGAPPAGADSTRI
eukprot:5885523-Prymnesium_polylepis.1